MDTSIRLSTNENLLGPSPLVLQAMTEALSLTHFYPGEEGDQLKHKLANKYNLQPENVVLDNGASGVLMTLARSYCLGGGVSLIPKPYFPLFETATKMHGGRCEFVEPKDGHAIDLEAVLKAITPATKLVFLTNPNNPTGLTFTQNEADDFMRRVPESVLVIFDEAYFEYVEQADYPDSLNYVRAGRNVIVLRTFSKVYGLAGLRIGYGLAPAPVIAQLRQNKYHISALTLRAALASLDDEAHVANVKAVNTAGRKFLYQAFDDLDLTYLPAQGNFILIINLPQSEAIEAALLKRNIHVRSTDKVFPWPHCLRITVGTPDVNAKLVAELRAVLAELKSTEK